MIDSSFVGLRYVALIGLLQASVAIASPLVYAPLNPSFGGNPANGPNLLSVANAQNRTSAPQPTPLEKFNASLQQSILNKLSTEATNTIFGTSSTLKPGSYDTGTYRVDITPGSDGSLTVTTTDKTTGATATFLISNPGQL